MFDFIKSISIEFFAAFLGFLFALLLDEMIEARKSKSKKRLVIINVIAELKDIHVSLLDYINNHHNLEYTIQTPSWDAIQNAGITIELISNKFYQDLISTYSLIKTYNEMLITKSKSSISLKNLIKIDSEVEHLIHEMEEEG